MTRIRTLSFLPEIFQTETNSQFLGATLDQLVNPPVTRKIEGYVGSKLGYGIDASDYYVTEPTKARRDYQLEPGIVFTKTNESVAKDFISYPGILDAIKLQNGLTDDNNRLFESQFYSWDSFTNLDMIINYNQYYWLPEGPPAVTVASSTVFRNSEFIVQDLPNTYNIRAVGAGAGSDNPTITLIRGGTYTFAVNQSTQFWIQGEPGVTGFSPVQTNLYTRDVFGVTNNGATDGIVTFNVPQKNAQDEYDLPGNNQVGVVSTKTFSAVNGAKVNQIGGIDGVTALNGRTVLFYNTGTLDELAYVSSFYSQGNYDTNTTLVSLESISATSIDANGNITVSSTEPLFRTDPDTGISSPLIGSTITFSGNSFGGIETYATNTAAAINASSMVSGQKYFITSLGTTDWINAGAPQYGSLDAEIVGNELRINKVLSGNFGIGMTLEGGTVANGTKITQFDEIATNQNYVFADSLTVGNLYSIRSFETDGGVTTDFTAIGAPAAGIISAEISGNVLTVDSIITGDIPIGSYLTGPGLASGTIVTERIYTGSTPTNSYYVNKTQTLPITTLTVQPGLGSFFVATGVGTGSGTVGIPTYTVDTAQLVGTSTINVYNIVEGTLFTANGSASGTGTVTPYIVSIYYIKEINSITNTIKISETLDGPVYTPNAAASGSMIGYINEGLYEEGYYVNVNDYFFNIVLLGDVADPVIQLIPSNLIPAGQKITALYGTQYVGLSFFKNESGAIEQLPYISAPLDILYYQDGSNPNKVGVIKLIESNLLNTLNVETDILGQKNFTSTNGIVFTNGLKVIFDGDVLPRRYLQGEYYVQGVGTAIELVPVDDLINPESYTDATSIPFDSLPYDIGNYDGNLFIPLNADYITIARNSKNRNAWARSNRWFHIQVIQDTAEYLSDPTIVTTYGNSANKAVRPIIEFYPNLKLFNSGTIAKNPVDFIDTRTTAPFDLVAGQATYYPDVETYTTYTGSISANPDIISGLYVPGQQYTIKDFGTTTLSTWNDLGLPLVFDGEFLTGVEYIIWDPGTPGVTDWNTIAGTPGPFVRGTIFTAQNPGTITGEGSGTALPLLFVAQISGNYNSTDLLPDQEYFISTYGSTNWENLGATVVNVATLETPVPVTALVLGKNYNITSLGTTTQENWNQIAGTTGVTYEVGSNFTCRDDGVGAGTGEAGTPYYIKDLTGVSQTGWNFIAGTTKLTYKVGDLITPVNNSSVNNGALVQRQFTTNTLSSGLPYRTVGTGFAYQGTGLSTAQTLTTVSIAPDQVTGNLAVGMYINDLILNQESQLPPNTRILSIEGTDTYNLTVFWDLPTTIAGTSGDASFVASTKNNADLKLFSGARIVFAAETNEILKNKIYVVNFSNLDGSFPVITLTEAVDGDILENDQFVITRGQVNQGDSFYFDGVDFILAQSKPDVNVAPKFDVFDKNGISFGNQDIYESSTFNGNDLFRYKPGSGPNDSILGFPISFSSINNVGDIRFDIALNSDTFNYVKSVTNQPVVQNVNTGFVRNYIDREEFTLLTGWQTAVAPSTQYQVFEFNYAQNDPPLILDGTDTLLFTVTCDVGTLPRTDTVWPNLLVYNNNTLLTENTDYTVVFNENDTVINIILAQDIDTVIQVLLLSDQVSESAYYSIPINLSNNPFNTDVTSVDIGDIRGHYQTIFDNNPDSEGVVFGSNNTRDLGNIVPYGTRIIQNSASLVLPGAFLRDSDNNIFNALEYNSREYVKFKTLLVDTVNKTDYAARFDPAYILDDALDQITSVKNQDMPFFWSDMIPNKAPFIVNTYTLENTILTSTFPLAKIYDFSSANYDGVLVYLQTTINKTNVTKQLYKDIDYTISTDSPAVIVNTVLNKDDKIIVKQYNQTYGSYIPNTPTKLGLYPLSIPKVILDTSYVQPTYFILGHDGSYNKLYGNYDPVTGLLDDYRDQVLLEFEIRVYNNIKLSSTLPITEVDITPGYFRNGAYSYNDWLQVYSPQFLNWIGQNRLDYKTQLYVNTNPYTYNYKNSQNKLNNDRIVQGYWRGIYEYYYDTSTPNTTPWEMIGYVNKPDWWENRYGPAPYTSDNLVLWTDLENGIDYNDGDPVVIPAYKRPGLTKILPVDDQGNLLQPLFSVVGNYNNNTLQRDWVVGDDAPVEFSYRKSSTYPFDVMRLYALMKPAKFFNLCVDLDNYKYDPEFNQYLVNGRSHLIPSEIEIYGNGTAKTSYINWIVDYQKQFGISATQNITTLLDNLDARLIYRLAGFSDKTMLKFFVEKGTPESSNASLLIPDESYQILLYQNQAYERLVFSSVVIQLDPNGYKVYGNSQNIAYFTTLAPIKNNNKNKITVQDATVSIYNEYSSTEVLVPYGTQFFTLTDLSQFLVSYGKYLESVGMKFADIESGIELNWQQMVAEFLFWSQVGWEPGSIITLNPAAKKIVVDKDRRIVQPLTLQQTNFILNQNLYPISNNNLSIFRDGSLFSASALNEGDTLSYAQFNLSNMEHGIVFDNTTLFNDVIYDLVSGLKQNRIYVRGTKSAEWNGTMFASGFIYNQDNVEEYSGDIKYTKGSIVKYKNKYWTALKIIQPGNVFNERDWKETDYEAIQRGLLPNSSTRSYESTLYYNTDQANLEDDADQLSFSLIGFRPRPYMSKADLTDITQVNVYKNFIKEKGTRNALNAFKNAQLPQGEIDYNIYENWAILQGTFGGVLNSNFVDFKLNEAKLNANPSIVALTNGQEVAGAEQLVPLYSLYNYGRPLDNENILSTTNITYSPLLPDAGYVNINDVKMSSFYYSGLAAAVDRNGLVVPINRFYINDYVWLADYLATWQILTPFSIGQVIEVRANLNNTSTVVFATPHDLSENDIFAIINFDDSVNGYYAVDQVINPYQVIITLALGTANRVVNGQGIGLGFNNARVAKPSDIKNLPLLNYEFSKNTVWVDQAETGTWGVYRKTNNYVFDAEFTKPNSVTFGTAVNYTTKGDFLISDSGLGRVYRYQYDPLTKEYNIDQSIPLEPAPPIAGFGVAIASAENIFAISKPEGSSQNNRYVQLRVVNDTNVSDDIVLYQFPNLISISGSTNFGSALAFSGDTNYLYVSDYDEATPTARNKVHVYRKNNILLDVTSVSVGQTYQIVELGDTDFTAIGAVENKVGIYFRAGAGATGTGKVRQCDYQYVNTIDGPNTSVDKFAYSISTNYYGDMLIVGAPLEDYDGSILDWGRAYVYQRTTQNFEAQETEIDQSFTLAWTPDPSLPITVEVNGTYVQATEYAISGNTITFTGELNAGDLIYVGSNDFVLVQTLETEQTPRIGVRFGTSVATNRYGNEFLVGAPFALSSDNQEGAIYRYTYGSARFGYIAGVEDTNVTSPRTLLLNGYEVTIPAGNAALAANAINNAAITNVQATTVGNKLMISLIDQNLSLVNEKLTIGVTESITLQELGFDLLSQTQIVLCPHKFGPTQFGTVIKFNERGSFVASAPVGTRYALTTFDFIDDANLDNDTLFDNNATQFLDKFDDAGAVYMFDYLENDNENLSDIGAYVYAQSVNDYVLEYGQQPLFGTALDFSNDIVTIGTPNFRPDTIDGRVIVYVNETGENDWTIFREPNATVDINTITNTQLYSAETNDTLINLDYFDPLQGKLLGAIQENIDIISNTDPASYNNQNNTQSGFVWGSAQIGTVWFDTTTTRFINYHQNDNDYNARYWGTVFPGSDVSVYSWIASNESPANYTGQGTPKDISLFTVQTVLNSNNEITPVYYFWVRNSGIIFNGKTLADVTIAEYINNPLNTGIAYMSPILPNAFAFYNTQTYVNANDTVFHIGFSTSQNDDPAHQEYSLIREDFASDFLPGLPDPLKGIDRPIGLYDRLLDALSGVDERGQVVPDPFLPKAVQSGVLARPRQSFFYDRFLALKNYIQYCNSVLALFPITELRSPSYLNESGEFYDTKDYWEYVNWWAVGYNNNTKSIAQVPLYADLSTLNVAIGSIVTVEQNGQGFSETYIYEGEGVWTRIGLQNGTIAFKSDLYDYNAGKYGFGGDFYSTTPFDQYPSEPTRWIVRAINEQIFVGEFLIYRNKALILLFEFIQSETLQNQNYLPWLNKTSLVDVGHTIRELKPIQNYNNDNQEFLEGYVNEVKPYHVVVKEFLFDYKGNDVYQGNLTDFDLPSKFDSQIENFVSPQLVYSNPNTAYEFLPDAAVWSDPDYAEWRANYGISLVGQDDYPITKLASYVTLGSDFLVVDNAQGFPINGTIKIADIANPTRFEIISYSSVDRALNTISGLARGLNDTPIFDHLPGETIYIDLPAVVLLDGGRSYSDPPRVIAYIDPLLYPAPAEEAVLEAVMSLDSVLEIKVVNPGKGYAVLPEILIDPSETFTFSSANVNVQFNTVEVYAPSFQTGDLAKYVAGETNIGGLQDGQNYYVNVLDSTPTSIIALYTTYKDAINDTNRVQFLSTGTGDQTLELGAKASAISSSYPVRENNITLRFDRTSYRPQVKDWTPGTYYGAFFAGSYNNIKNVSSSSIELYSLNPDINKILASNQGLVLPIESVENERVLEWSGFERTSTEIDGNEIVLSFNADPIDEYPSGSTVGFTVGMPIKFTGDTGTNIVADRTYYVNEVIDLYKFTISETQFGPVYALTSAVVDMSIYTAQVVDTAIINTTYPGIREVTATSSTNNTLTVPLSAIGTGGTQGLYTGISLVFTGNVYGGIEEHVVYYVTSVLDSETFTIGETNNPLTIKVNAINAANQLILDTDFGLDVNDKIVFSNMSIDNEPVINFGGIIAGQIYYVREIGVNVITLSETLGGPELTLTAVTEGSTTYAYFTSQEETLTLTNGSGNMTMNIQLPASPGQVNGQQFTFYQTSGQYADRPGTIVGNLVNKTITQILASNNRVSFDGNYDRLYVGLPFTIDTDIGGLVTDKTYYMSDFENLSINCASTRVSTATIDATFDGTEMTVTNFAGDGLIYPGSVITGTEIADYVYVIEQTSGTPGQIGVYVVDYNFPEELVTTDLTVQAGVIETTVGEDTNTIYDQMPITFEGIPLGGLVIGQQYYVRHIIDSSSFIISTTKTGPAVILDVSTGVMEGIGSASMQVYMKAGDFISGDSYLIRTLGTTNFSLVGATLDVNNAGGFTVGVEYIISDLGTTSQSNWNTIANTLGVTYAIGDTFTAAVASAGGGDGAAYRTAFVATGAGTGTGTATVIVSDSSTEAALTQEILADPIVDISYILGGYRVIINNGGEGFTVNNTVTILGNQVGGMTPENDVTLTVSRINSIVPGTYSWSLPLESDGTVTKFICSGTTPGIPNKYFLKVRTANSFEVYSDPRMTEPVSGLSFAYEGYTETNATNVGYVSPFPGEPYTDITLVDASEFAVNQAVTFTELDSPDYTISEGSTYYIVSIAGNIIRVSDNPGGDPIAISDTTISDTNILVAKAGSFMLLPEPFYFNQSIVKYNNRVWECVVSNNDDEFIFGKWQELNSGDLRLNALDRVIGYYQPTVNMPGLDLNQIFTGLTYPNTTYKANQFNPDLAYPVDTILKDEKFYPTNINIPAIVYQGTNYLAPANLPNYSAFVADIEVTDNWTLAKIAERPMALTDLALHDSVYVLTSNNTATPLLTSNDGIGWNTGGFYVPIDTLEEDIPYVKTRLIASGLSLNSVTYHDSKHVAAGNNIITTTDLSVWRETYVFEDGVSGSLQDVQYVDTSFFTGYLAAGIKDGDGLLLYSIDGESWTEIASPAFSTYKLNSITFDDTSIIVVADGGVIYRATALDSWTQVETATNNLNSVLYADSWFAAVGDNGIVYRSTDGITWTSVASGTTENLNSVIYTLDRTEWTIVGDNNTILQTSDMGAIDWDTTQVFAAKKPVYTVKGDPFQAGYGPEEMVPGIVSDQLTMIVTTRAGTNWDATEYGHVGYDVVSLELDANEENIYSFDGAVQIPAQISVFRLDDGLSNTLYKDIDYTVDWINKTISLSSNIDDPLQLRIDVYEVGNGDQLVKSNTDSDPIRVNVTTGFHEIYLNCNYTAQRTNGGGIVQPETGPSSTEATAANSESDSILVDDISGLTLNGMITFAGDVFGGVTTETTYYVKSINAIRNTITISETLVDGIAGPVFEVSNATGNMIVIIQKGPGEFYTEPAMYHNGTRLVAGRTNIVFRTKSSNNAIVTYNTSGLASNTKITFDSRIFGGLNPHTAYYVKDVLSGSEFTVSLVPGGDAVALSSEVGTSIFVSQDYAPAQIDGGVTAKVIFAEQYDKSIDYLVYSFMTETEPFTYGYTLPQTQVTFGNDTKSYDLTNYINEVNAENAVVEVDGLRINPNQYEIDVGLSQLTFDTLTPDPSQTVAITTYNDTKRQNFNTQTIIAGTNQQVTAISFVDNVITYTHPTTTITTLVPHNLEDNDVVKIDGILGSYQLNDNVFIIEVLNSTQFNIFEYIPGNTYESSAPIVDAGTYISGGYVWKNDAYNVYDTIASGCLSSEILTTNVENLTVNAPVIFTEDNIVIGESTSIPEIIAGKTYYVKTIDYVNNSFTISESRDGNILILTNVEPAETEWQITHNLNTQFVSVTPVFANNVAVTGRYDYPTILYNDPNTVTVTFSTASTGNAAIIGNIANTESYYLHTQSSLSDTWTVNHNLNSQYVAVAPATDADFSWYGRYDGPTITYDNANSLTLTFSSDQTGNVAIIGSSNNDGYYLHTQSTPSSSWVITHNLSSKYLSVTPVYPNNVSMVGTYDFPHISYDSSNKLTLTFNSEQEGSAVIVGGTESQGYYVYSSGQNIRVSQWRQTNVERLWVTVNGQRVSSSQLRINEVNGLSILTAINPGDTIIITSMIPTATPDENVYLNLVDENGEGTVYRANSNTRTWTTLNVGQYNTTIQVDDISKITNRNEQTNITPAATPQGYYLIPLLATKNDIVDVSVYNNNSAREGFIEPYYLSLEVTGTGPYIQIEAGPWIQPGDELVIVSLEGKLIYVNGEFMRIESVDTTTRICDVQRGANGSMVSTYIPRYTEVYGLLEDNQMNQINYDVTWNRIPGLYNTTEGDPLQIAQSSGARFLRVDE